MEIHKPKPVHTLREFAKEVAIIVLGVVIALTGEQIVEDLQWSHKVQVATAAMRDELLIDDGPQIYQRAVMHPCVVAKLDAIRRAVEGGQNRNTISALADTYWLDFRTFDRLALDAANNSDVASHMPPAELSEMTSIYEVMPLMESTNAREASDIAQLRALPRAGGKLSEEERLHVLEAVEALRYDDQIIWIRAQAKLPILRQIGKLDPARVQKFIAEARAHYGACIKDTPQNRA